MQHGLKDGGGWAKTAERQVHRLRNKEMHMYYFNIFHCLVRLPVCIPARSCSCWSGRCRIRKTTMWLSNSSAMLAICPACSTLGIGQPLTTMHASPTVSTWSMQVDNWVLECKQITWRQQVMTSVKCLDLVQGEAPEYMNFVKKNSVKGVECFLFV